MKILSITFLVLFLSNFFPQSIFANENLIIEKNPFVEKSLNLLDIDDITIQHKVGEALVSKGITDPRIYEKLASVIESYAAKNNYKQMSWLALGLAASGDEQYKPLLEKLVSNSKGRGKTHASRALKNLATQQQINSIAEQLNFVGSSKIVEKNDFTRNILATLHTSDPELQIKAVAQLKDQGIQESLVYDKIKQIIEKYITDKNPKNDPYVAYLIKGLAYSGNESYRKTIENIPPDFIGGMQKYIKTAVKILDEQKILNPIFAKEDIYSGEQTWEAIRDANLILYSDEFKRIKLIAELAIGKGRFDALVFDAMNARILSEYQTNIEDKRKLNTYAYWTKAFSYFPSPDYIETLEKVSNSAANEKLRKYASTVLRKSGIRLSEVEELIENVEYNGESFGKISVTFLDPKSPQFEKVSSFKRMRLEAEILKQLDQINKFDPSSNNSLNIKITNYRVRSKASKVTTFIFVAPTPALLGPDFLTANIEVNIENQQTQQFQIQSKASPIGSGQFSSGEIKLRNDFLIKLMSIFKKT